MIRAEGVGRRMTLHVYAGDVPSEGDVMVRVHGPGPDEGVPTRAAPMLVLSRRPVTRGTCTHCAGRCERWSIEYVRVNEAPKDAGRHPITRMPPKTRTR